MSTIPETTTEKSKQRALARELQTELDKFILMAKFGLGGMLLLFPGLAWDGYRNGDWGKTLAGCAGFLASLAISISWTRRVPGMSKRVRSPGGMLELICKGATIFGSAMLPAAIASREWTGAAVAAGLLVASWGMWLRWMWVVWIWYAVLIFGIWTEGQSIVDLHVSTLIGSAFRLTVLAGALSSVVSWHRRVRSEA